MPNNSTTKESTLLARFSGESDYKADDNLSNEDEKTPKTPPLVDAARAGEIAFIQCLIDEKADLDAKDDDGNTALMAAIQSKNLHPQDRHKIIEMLLKAGASINAQNHDLDTALIIATRFNDQKSVAQLLAVKGILIEIQNIRGCTALSVAIRHSEKAPDNWVAMVEMLLEARANVNVKNNRGDTPWDIASQTKNSKMMELLLPYQTELQSMLKKAILLYAESHEELDNLEDLLNTPRENIELRGTNIKGLYAIASLLKHGAQVRCFNFGEHHRYKAINGLLEKVCSKDTYPTSPVFSPQFRAPSQKAITVA